MRMEKEVDGIFVTRGPEATRCLVPASRASLLHSTRTTTTSSLGLLELTTGKVVCMHMFTVKCNKSTLYEFISPAIRIEECACEDYFSQYLQASPLLSS